ncbi:hypothetical protein TNCV_4428941 [Trichonephila clavipes]|nr:hypothetical protein TNCV_4428941 [Trichonephila clavipes]
MKRDSSLDSLALDNFVQAIHRLVSRCGSPVVKVSDHGRHVISSSPVPLKTRRVRERCSVVVRRGGVSSGAVLVT